MRLSVNDHDRGSTYVYPVVSRRAGGVSVGINLNPNDACNWRCVYCQVPDLVFGSAPAIDVGYLEEELDGLLRKIQEDGWLAEHAPEGSRVLRDVAFSGNGEPTSSPQLEDAIEAAGRVLERRGLVGKIELVLITNGSLVHKPPVRRGIERMAALGGVVWFKLDSATDEGQTRMNDARSGVARARANLAIAAGLCPTWIQTMVLARNGEPPSEGEQEAYLELVRDLVRQAVPVRGVLLYGLARPSYQPEASELAPLPREWLEDFARQIESAGLSVKVSP